MPDPAVTQAQAALAPLLAEYKRQQEEERRRAQAAQYTATAGAEGLAGVLKGTAPEIEGVYKRAGDTTSAYAKGYSTAFQEGSEKVAAELNAFLAKQGSPQQITGAGAAGADVLYGLGGSLPASQMAREGAAFTSAAAQLPATARLQGNTQAGLIGAASREKLTQLEALMRGEKAKLPGMIGANRAQLADDKRADEALAINKWYLKNTLRKTGAAITGVDPVTGEPTAEVSAATAKAATTAREKKQAAVAKRNNATADAFVAAGDWVETQLKPGKELSPKGQVPIESHKVKRGKETIVYYVKKGGGTTTKIAEAETKTVYDEQLIGKPEYRKLVKQLTSRLNAQLRQFGYKPGQIRSMALDILDDYFTLSEQVPPSKDVPPQQDSNDRRGGR